MIDLEHRKKVVEMEEMPRNRDFDTVLKSFFNEIKVEEILKPGMRVLELGCGAGNTISNLAKTYGIEAYGIDLEDYRKMRLPKYSDVPFNFVKGDIMNLPFRNNSFDLVFSYFAFPYVEDKLKGLQEVHRVLVPNGKGVIDVNTLIEDIYSQEPTLIDELIFPGLEDIFMNYPNEEQLSCSFIPTKNIDPKDPKRKLRERRSDRAIITKKDQKELEFPRLRSIQRYQKTCWPLIKSFYSK